MLLKILQLTGRFSVPLLKSIDRINSEAVVRMYCKNEFLRNIILVKYAKQFLIINLIYRDVSY